MVSGAGLPWEVRLALYSTFVPPTSAVCGLSFSRSQPDFFSGYSGFPPSPKSTPSQKHWLLCSGIMHDRLAVAWGAFHMHSADPVWAAPFAVQPSGLQVRVISRTLLLLFLASAANCVVSSTIKVDNTLIVQIGPTKLGWEWLTMQHFGCNLIGWDN